MELSERNIRQLESEGFAMVYEVFDDPNTLYSAHKHETEHVVIVTEGSMEIKMNGETKIITTGQRYITQAGVEHTVKIGPEGCKYVIGE